MSVQSTPEFAIRPQAHRASRRRGFTAIEMVAVATIMVILSLILVINVRKRVDESKIVAAKEEINQLGNIESLVYGENSHYFPLQDLDNSDNYPATSGTDLPMAYFSDNLTSYPQTTVTQFVALSGPRQSLQQNWKGPYTQFKKYKTLQDLVVQWPEFFSVNGGTIMAAEDPLSVPPQLYDANDKYPLDPWGNPYIFEVLPNGQGGRISSLGPDGMPGTVTTPPTGPLPGVIFHTPSADYPQGRLGAGDDLHQDF